MQAWFPAGEALGPRGICETLHIQAAIENEPSLDLSLTSSTMKLSFSLLGLIAGHFADLASAVPFHSRRAQSSSSTFADDMFNTAIEWNDSFWNEDAGYLIAAASNPGRYDTRHTAWYATQLLARNGPGDVARAVRIFDNVISGQYLDPAAQWYGDYTQSPSAPQPGTTEYPDEGPYSSVRNHDC